MQVRTRALAGGAYGAYLLAPPYRHAEGYVYAGEVGVPCTVSEAVVDYYFVSVAGELEVRLYDHSVACGEYRGSLPCGKVLPFVETHSSVNGIDTVAERTRQMEYRPVGDNGRNAGNVGYHVSRGEGHTLHLVEQHALEIRSLEQVVHAFHGGL